MSKMQFHPLAELFPLMEGAEFDALAADIQANGLHEPIIVLDDKILDGRNRYRACEVANVEPIYQEWDNGGDPRTFVISKNLHRRHLNESQRAMIAAQIANIERGQVGAARKKPDTGISVPEAAGMLNVHHTTVTDARKVLREGTSEEIKAVKAGDVSVSTIANQIRKQLPPEGRVKKRAEPLSQSGRNPERIQRQQIEAEIWQRLSDALIHLSNLPLPTDAAAIVRKSSSRTRAVDARLSPSLRWLKEFSDAWHA